MGVSGVSTFSSFSWKRDFRVCFGGFLITNAVVGAPYCFILCTFIVAYIIYYFSFRVTALAFVDSRI